MTKRRNIFAAFLLLAFLVCSCSAGGGQSTPTPVPTPAAIQKPTYQVQRGTVAKVVQLQGRVSPVNQQDLFFRSDGYVRTVNFSRGAQVKAGDVLAELELGDLDIQVSQAQLALQESETKLAQAQQTNADEIIEAQLALDKANLQAKQAGALGINPSIEEAQAVLEAAEAALKAAKEAYQKAEESHNYIKKTEEEYQEAVDRAKWEVEAAQKRLESARTQKDFEPNLQRVQETLQAALQEYHDSASKPELTAQERTVIQQKLEQAKLDYVNTWLQYADIIAGPTYLPAEALILAKDLALARLRVDELKAGVDPMMVLDVEQRRLDLQTVQKKVDQARLVAPFDGQILSLSLTPGSQVSAFHPVLSLADPSALEITVRPSSEDLAVLGIGQAATVERLSHTGQTDAGHIRLMPYTVSTGAGNNQDQDQVVHISLDDPKIALTIGEAATVAIEVEKRENVLWLPPAALRAFQGRDFVFIEENGVQRRVDVRLGLHSVDRLEILEGLMEGQTVVGP